MDKYLKNKENIKDMYSNIEILSSKGQKILAAIYLVTNHLSDTDPLRLELRSATVPLALAVPVPEQQPFILVRNVTALLTAAYIAKLISEKNYLILRAELDSFSKAAAAGAGIAPEAAFELEPVFFEPEKKDIIKDIPKLSKGHITKMFVLSRKDTDSKIESKKSDRLGEIVSFINSKKMVSIKDITVLFPSVSEKTIQRELNRLLADGKIRKRGSKRWSVYLSLSA